MEETGVQELKDVKQDIKNAKENYVRVLIESNLDKTPLVFKFHVALFSGDDALMELKPNSPIYFKNVNGKIEAYADRKKIVLNQLTIAPLEKEEKLSYNNSQFRGIFRVKVVDESVALINYLPVEDYLLGVMIPEMGVANKPEDREVMKAFAICARTYAYMKINQSRSDYDLRSDVGDQVYRGFSEERDYGNQAVEETRNVVLTYEGSLAKTYYHSNCGGATENVMNVFSDVPIPYLSGVRDGDEPYCKIASNFSWMEQYSYEDIIEALYASKKIESKDCVIRDIIILDRFNSGRVNRLLFKLEFSTKEEKEVVLYGNSIRFILRSKSFQGILRSVKFDLAVEKKDGMVISVAINGFGSGHGVGLCQWGAIGQSRKGKSYKEILQHYYPGTKTIKIGMD